MMTDQLDACRREAGRRREAEAAAEEAARLARLAEAAAQAAWRAGAPARQDERRDRLRAHRASQPPRKRRSKRMM